jgi:hypothetical protein
MSARIRDLNETSDSIRGAGPETEQGSTMQAIVHDRYGSADVLHLSEIERPVIAE